MHGDCENIEIRCERMCCVFGGDLHLQVPGGFFVCGRRRAWLGVWIVF